MTESFSNPRKSDSSAAPDGPAVAEAFAPSAKPPAGPPHRPPGGRAMWLWIGPLAGAVVALLLEGAGLERQAGLCGAITTLTAIWWLTEPIPVAATSIVALALFPLAGVLDSAQAAQSFGHPLVVLMMGGFMLSRAMESSDAHRLVAARMIQLAGGTRPGRLVLGFMLASAGLSMWISNTATALMLLPAALAVVDRSRDPRLATPLLLGIAYAASIGGMATPIGTPPNIIFMGVYAEQTGATITFLRWMMIGLPITLVLLPLAWWWLTRSLRGVQTATAEVEPRRNPAQKRVLVVFGLAALAWMTRTEPLGGWSGLVGLDGVDDSTVALAAVAALFLLPDGRQGRLLAWADAVRIPWGVLLLFGAGIAIANAFQSSGLSEAVAAALQGLASWPVILVIAGICVTVTLLTEVTSNTATTTLLMPLMAAAAVASGLPPALLMVPAALSASCAFMLPVATPPNAVVFASQRIAIAEMARQGAVLNFIGAVAITLACWLFLGYLELI